jgi:hypothetical protein
MSVKEEKKESAESRCSSGDPSDSLVLFVLEEGEDVTRIPQVRRNFCL